MKKKLLLVDDDECFARIIGDFFEDNDFCVLYAGDGQEALAVFINESPDLVLLDVDLPIMSGFEVMESIRSEDFITPIIFISGFKLDEESKIRGYELGAIQYLEKPIHLKVLLAQIKSWLNPSINKYDLTVGERVFKLRSQILTVEDLKICLREREASVLAYFFAQPNVIVTRKQLLQFIWGDVSLRNNATLDNLILALRKKLQVLPELNIRSYYSKGYMLVI
jgi:two-component system, OmpR family, response regulator